MELDEQIIDAHWTKDENGKKQFFIINEGIISKLCILGEDTEPCFEGSQITKVQFSFEDDFKQQLFSMINEIKNILNEGGASMDENTPVVQEPIEITDPVVEEPAIAAENPVVEEPVIEEPADAEPVAEPVFEETCPECGKPVSECECDEDKPAQYNLDEIPEYIELRNKYEALENDYNSVCAIRDELTEFKNGIVKEQKEAMIKSFYMLSEEDKKEVIDNIDTYSLEDIEAKLSIICVRNKVSFNLAEDNDSNEPVVVNLEGNYTEDVTPAWVKAIQNNVAE